MKKTLWIALTTLALLQINPLAVQAGRGGHGGYGGNYGYGGHRGYNGYRGNNGHGGHYGVNVWLGPGLLGPYYPYYSYYPYYPYYPAPPVVIQQQPQEYIVKPVPEQTEPAYWYHCQNPVGYYPYVQRCPSGWAKVLPTPPSAD